MDGTVMKFGPQPDLIACCVRQEIGLLCRTYFGKSTLNGEPQKVSRTIFSCEVTTAPR